MGRRGRVLGVVVASLSLLAGVQSWSPHAGAVPSAPAEQPPTMEPGTDPALVGGELVRGESVSSPELTADLPAAGTAVARLGEVGEFVRVGEWPIEVAARSIAEVGSSVTIRVFDKVEADRVDASAFVFGVGIDGLVPRAVDVRVDYDGFKDLYGASYRDRLVLKTAPSCLLGALWPEICELAELIPEFVNDRAGFVLSGVVEALPPDASGDQDYETYAVTSSTSGTEYGNWAASPLASSAAWQVGLGSGEFSWNYPIPAEAAPAGPTPQLSLSYSSGSIDGMTSNENNQAGQAGLGWSVTESFIERRYWSCRDDGRAIDDLCWQSDNATLVLNGVATELIQINGTEWRAKDDPNWKVTRLTGAPNGDNDGEYWRVITPDGVRYTFGYGYDLENEVTTNSAWKVPVFGDDAGEPGCAKEVDLWWCTQAWRWNLDRVEDPNANVTTYRYNVETQAYGFHGVPQNARLYDRGGSLAVVEYGIRAQSGAAAEAKITLSTPYRCNTLSSSCPAATASNGLQFPDVPAEFICTAAPCSQTAPSFFSTVRYETIASWVRNNAGSYDKVDSVGLGMVFETNDVGLQYPWLRFIDHDGYSEGYLPLPTVRMDSIYGYLPNRPGTNDLRFHRVDLINDHFGSETWVTYGQPNPCQDGLSTNPAWDVNTEDCFPVYYGPNSSDWRVHNKYVVTQVRRTDGAVSGAVEERTGYVYSGRPAWHHDDTPTTPASKRSWNEWRGYDTVEVQDGSGSTISRTQYRVFRGMNADKVVGGGSRSVTITPLDSSSPAYSDHWWLTGRVLDERSLDAAGAQIVATTHTYVSLVTAAGSGEARWVGESSARERWADGASTRYRATTTSYDGNRLPATVVDTGWEHVTGDERCQFTLWNANTTDWLLEFPRDRVTRDSNCTSGDTYNEEWYYDGGSKLTPPTEGNLTQHRQQLTTSSFATTTSAYDSSGRAISVTDPEGRTTTTTHSPTVGYPHSTTTRRVLSTGDHVSTTTWHNEHRSLPASMANVNGQTTSLTYDPLGRLTSVSRPGDGGNPSLRYEYYVDGDKNSPHTVRTRVRQSGSTYQDSWVVYDALLRERQTHAPSPTAGKMVVTSIARDNRGNVVDVTLPYAASTSLVQTVVGWPAGVDRTVTTYDALSRPTRDERFDNMSATPTWQTTTAYTYNSTTVNPPVGGDTLTVVDGLGRTTAVTEQDGVAQNTTSYTYRGGTDLLATITEAGADANRTTTLTYDRAGRLTQRTDPDTGTSTITYDDTGNPVDVTTPAVGGGTKTVHHDYDGLGRLKGQCEGTSTSGPKLATRTYDTATNGVGMPATATAYDGSAQYKTTWAYDTKGRATTRSYTLPAAAGAELDGTYTFTYGYDAADHLTSVAYPAIGDLPAETVTTAYTAQGFPSTLTGNGAFADDDYVTATAWTDLAQLQSRVLGSASDPNTHHVNRLYTWHTDTRRLTTLVANVDGTLSGTTITGGTIIASAAYAYDVVGNVTSINRGDEVECFTYDDRLRLKTAFTRSNTTCAALHETGVGPAPYNHTYAFDARHRMTSANLGAGAKTYSYSDTAHPHAPTSFDGTSFAWNPDGTLAASTTGGEITSYDWDPLGRLAAVTGDDGAADASSEFIYGPDGDRWLRSHTTPPGQGPITETATFGSSSPPATRTVELGAGPVDVNLGWGSPVVRTGPVTAGSVSPGGEATGASLEWQADALVDATIAWPETTGTRDVSATASVPAAGTASTGAIVTNVSGALTADVTWVPSTTAFAASGTYELLEPDVFPVVVTGNGTIDVTLRWDAGVGKAQNLNLQLLLDGVVVKESSQVNTTNERIVYAVSGVDAHPASRTYQLRVNGTVTKAIPFTIDGFIPVTANVSSKLVNTATGATVATGTPVAGERRHTFSVASLPAGSYRFDATSTDHSANVTVAGRVPHRGHATVALELRDAADAVVASATGNTGSLQLTRQASVGGLHRLVVVDTDTGLATGAVTGTWTITNLATTRYHGTVPGILAGGASHTIAAAAPGPVTTTVTWAKVVGVYADLTVVVRDPNGTVIGSKRSDTGKAVVTGTTPVAGDLRITVSNNGAVTGEYNSDTMRPAPGDGTGLTATLSLTGPSGTVALTPSGTNPRRYVGTVTTPGTHTFTVTTGGGAGQWTLTGTIPTPPSTAVTAYLPGHEVTSVDGGDATAIRTYAIAGTTVAVRDADGLTWQVNDHHATPTAWVDAATGAASTVRTDPYGNPRGTPPAEPPNDHGFLDKPVDPTGLVQMGARYYQPGLRAFTAPDPISDPNQPVSLNPYAYGGWSPVVLADPTGLCPDGGNTVNGACQYNGGNGSRLGNPTSGSSGPRSTPSPCSLASHGVCASGEPALPRITSTKDGRVRFFAPDGNLVATGCRRGTKCRLSDPFTVTFPAGGELFYFIAYMTGELHDFYRESGLGPLAVTRQVGVTAAAQGLVLRPTKGGLIYAYLADASVSQWTEEFSLWEDGSNPASFDPTTNGLGTAVQVAKAVAGIISSSSTEVGVTIESSLFFQFDDYFLDSIEVSSGAIIVCSRGCAYAD